jgi:peptidoglycan/xylan/chitin deacetylase (PgdA/CDA1 family)
MRLFRPWYFFRLLYPDAIFRIKTTQKQLHLTFDDGPHPHSTPQLLDILDRYNIKAQFFCSGLAAEKFPDLIKTIKSGGHNLGNHGYYHLNGWVTSTSKYLADVADAAPSTSYELFRPPYGRIGISQYLALKKSYKIVFWDLMPYDFDSSFSRENCLRILKSKIRNGSVIVLHDTPHSYANTILEEFLYFSLNEGYRFEIPHFTSS